MANLPFIDRHRWVPGALGVIITLINLSLALMSPYSWLRWFNVFAFFLSTTIGWYYSHRNFAGWIYFSFGTMVDVGLSQRVDEFTDDKEASKSIVDWLKSSGVKFYTKTSDFCYFFLRKKDAVAFKLAWG